MEPLNDRELDNLLRTWDAPDAPAHLRPPRRTGSRLWDWLLHGQIRIPVPAVLATAVIVALSLWWGLAHRPSTPHAPTVSFAEFQPVKQLEPRVIRSKYEGQ